MNSNSKERGFLFAAVGDQFVDEAKNSALSIRKQMPLASITLVTDREMEEFPFSKIIVLPISAEGHKGIKLYKPLALANSPYKRTVFLDSDTYVCQDCQELFDMNDHVDLALAHDTADMSNPIVNGHTIAGMHPYNSGVIAFEKCEKMNLFFKNWYNVIDVEHANHPWDQRAMMTSIIDLKIRTYTLHQVYNCRINFIISLPQLPVKIIHGRGVNFLKTEKKLNKILKNRVWMPKREKVFLKRRRNFFKMIYQKLVQKLNK